jgi:hypothetical protein
MGDLEFRKLLGQNRVRTLLLAVLASALIFPAHARASSRTGGASPAVAASAHPAVEAPVRAGSRGADPAAAAVAATPAGTAATVPAPPARPAASPAAPAPEAYVPAAVAAAAPAPHPDAWTGRHRTVAETVGHPGFAPPSGQRAVSGPSQPTASFRSFDPTSALAPGRAFGREIRRQPPVRARPAGIPRDLVRPRRDPEPAHVVISPTATTPISSPVPTSLPPGGADGSVAGAGGAAAGTAAAAVIALAGMILLGALLPGLLALDALPWRSAVCALRLERPG